MKYTKGDTIVGFEKLWFLQKRHATRYASTQSPLSPPKNPSHSLVELAVKPTVALLDSRSSLPEYSFYDTIPQGERRKDFVAAIIWADVQNYTNPEDFIARNNYFFISPSADTLTGTIPALKLHKIPPLYSHAISRDKMIDLFRLITDVPAESWDLESLRAVISEVVSRGVSLTLEKPVGQIGPDTETEAVEMALKKSWIRLVHGYLRWVLVAGKPGPDGVEMMKILGKEEMGRRLAVAAEVLRQGGGASERRVAL
jgi:glutamyl-tRNA synthetase